jgi:hypothetical protein
MFMPKRTRSAGEIVEESEYIETKSKGNLGTKILLILFILVVVALVASLLSRQRMSQKVTKLSTVTGQKEMAKKDIDQLVKKVSKLIVLPTGETPTIATINDAMGLAKNQTFYKGSINGDKVLIYFKAQKAYIYSPSKNVLVNVGPIYVDKSAKPTTTETQEIQKKIKLNIEIRNGSDQSGLATQTANELGKISDFNVSSITDAVTNTYKNNVIVDLSKGTKKGLVVSLEKQLGVKSVSTLPNEEKTTIADVLVIVAK